MIDISELEVFFLNEYGYLELHEQARELLNENIKRLQGAKIKIITEKEIDIFNFLEKDNRITSFAFYCDYIKYYYLLNSDSRYCLYIDLDTIISNESIQFILNNPNSFYISDNGCSNLVYLDKNNKEEAERIFNIMLNLGVYEYFKLRGDFYISKLIEEKYKKLSHEIHLNLTPRKSIQIKKSTNAELIKEIINGNPLQTKYLPK